VRNGKLNSCSLQFISYPCRHRYPDKSALNNDLRTETPPETGLGGSVRSWLNFSGGSCLMGYCAGGGSVLESSAADMEHWGTCFRNSL